MARSIELARLFVTLEAETKGLQNDLDRSERALGRIGDFILKNPVAALGSLAAAAGVAAIKLASMAADFEQSMTEVGTLVDKNSVDMQQLADDVLGLFRSLPVSSLQDLTQGLYNVISAGIPAGDAIDFLRVAAEAAVGGVTDVNTAVDGLTTATNAFTSQGVTATEAADAFFVAVRAGKTTFGELSGEIGNVAGLANSLGVSLDDLLANTSALTLGGLKTSEAMNALRQVLANVAKPTAELRKEYPQLAKDFDLAALKSKGLTQFMLDLGQRLAGNSDAAVKMFGSVEALNAVLTVTANDGAKVRDITAQMAEKSGAARAAFTEMAGTTKNLFQILKNEFGASLIELGQNILPIVNAGLGATLSVMKALNSVFDAFRGKDVVKISDAIGAAEIKNLREVLSSPLFNGEAIDLSNLQAGTRQFKVLTSAIMTMRDVTRRDLPDALKVSDEALVRIRGTVEAYAKAHVKSLGAAGASAERTAQQYLDMLKFIDAEIAKRAKPAPPPGTRPIDEEAAAKSTRALEAIAKAANASQLALLEAQHREYTAAVQLFQEKVADLTAADRTTAEGLLKKHLGNLLLKWAGFDAAMERRVPTLEKSIERTAIQGRSVDELAAALERYSGKSLEAAKAEDIAVAKKRLLIQEVVDVSDAYAKAAGELGEFLDILGASSPQTDAFVAGIQNISAAIGQIALGDTLGGIKTGLAGIAAFAKVAFAGESASARAVREALSATRQKLTDHQRTIGDLIAIQAPGRSLSGVESVLGGIDFSKFPENDLARDANDKALRRVLGTQLLSRGLTFADLDDVAEVFGQKLTDDKGRLNARLLQRLFDLLASTETGFSNTFGGQLDRIRANKEVGIGDELTDLIALIRDPKLGIPAITGALNAAGDDPQARVAALRALFEQLGTPGAISKASLGGASEAEFRAVIGQLIGLLTSSVEEAAGLVDPPPDTGSGETVVPPPADPGVDSTIPPSGPGPRDEGTTGLDLTSITSAGFAAANDYLADILEELRAFRPVLPPVLPSSLLGPATASSSRVNVTFGDIHLHAPAGIDVGDTAAVATALREELTEYFERKLGENLDQARAFQGSAVRI